MEKRKYNGSEVPIDITGPEYRRVKENLKIFNESVSKESRLTFDEFVSLVFETAQLEEKLEFKYDYLNILKSEIRKLEEELTVKYSTGLKDCDETDSDVIELRRQALRDSSDYINGLY